MAFLSIIHGDGYEAQPLTALITESDDVTPIDLTGASLWFMVKEKRSDADIDALISKTEADGITIAPNQTTNRGELTIELTPEETTIGPAVYWWELQGKQPGGDIVTLASGRFEVAPDLVRATS